MTKKEVKTEFNQKIGRAQVRAKRLLDMVNAANDEIQKYKQIITQMNMLKSQALNYLENFDELGGPDEPQYNWTLYDFNIKP